MTTLNIGLQDILVKKSTNFDHVRIIIMEEETCPICFWRGSMLIMYGHKECPNCKNNIEPCCEGQQQQECKPRIKLDKEGEM